MPERQIHWIPLTSTRKENGPRNCFVRFSERPEPSIAKSRGAGFLRPHLSLDLHFHRYFINMFFAAGRFSRAMDPATILSVCCRLAVWLWT